MQAENVAFFSYLVISYLYSLIMLLKKILFLSTYSVRFVRGYRHPMNTEKQFLVNFFCGMFDF